MCRKLLYIVSLNMLFGSVTFTSALTIDITWDNGGTGNLWSTAQNWDPNQLPTATDTVAINLQDSNCLINSSVDANYGILILGYNTNRCYLDMTGGTLTGGKFILGGTNSGVGKMIMTGGNTFLDGLYVGYKGIAHIDLCDGTINTGQFVMRKEATSTGTMDIETGTLKIDGDAVEEISEYRDDGWITGYGINDTRAVKIEYDNNQGKTTVAGNIFNPAIAWNPSPQDEFEYAVPDVILTWSSGDYASDVNGHDVYFGDNYNDVNNATTASNKYMGEQTPNTWDSNNYDSNGLTAGQTYYWRIDEVNDSNSESPWKGDTWSFTIRNFAADIPLKAWNPNPVDDETDIDRDMVLSWWAGKDANDHDVYFGDNYNDVNDATTASDEYMGNQLSTNWDPNNYDSNGLDLSEKYYWRIDEVDVNSSTEKGSVWNFTVASYILVDDFESYDVNNPVDDTWIHPDGGVGLAEPNIYSDDYGEIAEAIVDIE